jgi:hypothetical protein
MMKHRRRLTLIVTATGVLLLVLLVVPMVAAATPTNVRLTNDAPSLSGYISAYTLATGIPYTDPVLTEASIARGRQNEPAIEIDPRDPRVMIGSSNDYAGVYAGSTADNYVPAGPIWLGYYRSEDEGATWISSLVPGYPGDTSPYAALAKIRTASSGDPVIAWDKHGRVFMGSESSDDPAATLKTFGDEWVATYVNPDGPNGDTLNDGKQFARSIVVAKGSSAPYLLGKFNDKTAIEADRTTSRFEGNVYFSWSRFTGNGGVAIYFARSTDHGKTWSQPMKISAGIHDVQFPDIAVTDNGDVFVTYRMFASNSGQPNAIVYVKSTNGGRSFSMPRILRTFVPYDAEDRYVTGGTARDGGDFSNAVLSGYTFFRRDTQVRSAADQNAANSHDVYIVYDPTKPGTEVASGTTYGSVGSGTGSQSAIYFIRLNGETGNATTPKLIDDEATGPRAS